MRDGELVTAVTVPAAALGKTAAFAKLALYTGDRDGLGRGRRRRRGRRDLARRPHRAGCAGPTPLRMHSAERAVDAATAPTPHALARAVDAELDRIAHPLPGNAWKLDAAAGLAEQAAEELVARATRSRSDA
ncbi:hypothetical protein BJF78_00980 [Pseudonocardia sp. CNS-139]|nr:hypothetical protein BJF78_00980 [Pseudonocardia sp. CNS-139]